MPVTDPIAIAPSHPSPRNLRYAVGLLVAAVPLLLLLADNRIEAGAAYLGAAVALVLLTYPRAGFYMFVASIGAYFPYFLSDSTALLPADGLLAALVAVSMLEFLLRGSTSVAATAFDRPFLALLGGVVISGLFAHNPAYSVVPVARIVVVYLAYRISYKFAREIGVRRVLLYYVYVVVALSAVNAVLFLMQGGKVRVFGPAWLAYETLSMTALPMAFAFLVWAQSVGKRMWFGLLSLIIGFGMLASGSRGPMLAVVIAVPILMFFGWRKARRERSISSLRVLRTIMIPLLAIGAVVMLFQGTLLSGLVERVASLIDSIRNPQETVLLRLVLAKAAVQAFLADPITGIGIGNFKIVDQVVPQMRMEPVWFYIRGMSAHNVILHFLAETGLLGTIPLVWLALAGLRTAARAFGRPASERETQVSAAVFVGMTVFFVTLFYMRAWTWGQGGYIMALLFAVAAARRSEFLDSETAHPVTSRTNRTGA